jgi:plastocyanin
MKLRGLVALAVPIAVFALAPPAAAATVSVSISGFAFGPHSVTAAQGATVRWTNDDSVPHTSTSDHGFWGSPHIASGQQYAQTTAFMNSGTYPYHCMIHPDMTGRVLVPLKASGSASAGWTLRWSSLSSTPSNRAFDVQIKRPGSSTWAAFRTDTTKRSAAFDPAKHGTYSFRAHTRNLTNGTHSGWSPVRQLKIS